VRLRVHGRSAYQLRLGIELCGSHRSVPRDTVEDPLWFQRLPISCSWQTPPPRTERKTCNSGPSFVPRDAFIERPALRLILAYPRYLRIHDGHSYKAKSRLGSKPKEKMGENPPCKPPCFRAAVTLPTRCHRRRRSRSGTRRVPHRSYPRVLIGRSLPPAAAYGGEIATATDYGHALEPQKSVRAALTTDIGLPEFARMADKLKSR